ncbi:endonuclease/exonuclease/phosphatase family protein [Halobacteriovorax sp. JY17]|uniref:endonuclease/exonuclease/phosphatase family protein n=1 Tax=Halobacteriovorax sp. JY17 TaxID=2014617 RepID=UPI000C5AB2A6|nr:endonuclease/exonuclease/phosphatase family protein [Halobacteriovorax sp. JY17]PIK16495.1 MAG: hypothetical protein CES88_07080 [Halobacteriovorax sp. JY17]
MKILALGLLLFINFQNSANAWLGVEVPEDDNVIKPFGHSKKTEIEKETIDVFVWNIYKANKENWKEQFTAQTPSFDFFLLQEMLTIPLVEEIFNNTEEANFTTATSFIYKKNSQRTGVATGAKYSPSWKKFLRSKKREPILSTPKITLFTKYPIKGSSEELLIVNIHAINFVSSFTLHSQLKDAADIIKEHNGPSVFAGDFNTWTLEKQIFLKKITKEVGMTEVTFKNDDRKKMFGWILDFIFVKGLEIVDSKVHSDLDGSDHKAISVKLKFIKH